ncbi:MAG: ATP-binding protein [Candidatus Eremiobacteraeota bacterium]|nr:ATP-binding protein [Candidatus Eremiobacteraeota bacterium]MBV8353799.1 ATP-binding protein [Candidatus Eremiobacteraeota bacterium]
MNLPEPVTESLGVVDVRIPAKAEWVAVARLAAAGIGSRLRFSIDDLEDLKLAIAEACTCVIQGSDGAQSIDIRCESLPNELRVSVQGDGRGTKPERVRPDDSGITGLGVFLIRSLMDTVDYEVDSKRGPRIVMSKRVQT